MKQQRTPYQRLKIESFSFLNEDTGSLFYHLTQKRLNKKENHKKAILNILKDIRRAASFFDIVRQLIIKNDINKLTELIIGEKASSSKKAILCGYDVCLSCNKDTVCQKTLTPLNKKDKINFLMYLRFVRTKKILNMLKWSYHASCFNVLLQEPLLLKFIANYALVVDIKNELKKEGKIANHKTLYKGAGKYCPFNDLYQV